MCSPDRKVVIQRCCGSIGRVDMAKQGLMYLLLLFALVVVVANSQDYPRFEFGSRDLPNNSYIFRGDIGEGVNNSLRCVTDYSDCCSGFGSGMGNWYDEQGMEVHQRACRWRRCRWIQ